MQDVKCKELSFSTHNSQVDIEKKERREKKKNWKSKIEDKNYCAFVQSFRAKKPFIQKSDYMFIHRKPSRQSRESQTPFNVEGTETDDVDSYW